MTQGHHDWIARVYVGEGETLRRSWMIQDRTENEATKEAMAEVERNDPGDDWTLTMVEVSAKSPV